MTDLPLMRCLEPGCRALVPRGRCLAHYQAHSLKQSRKDYREPYKTGKWKAASAAFRKAHPLCAHCLLAGKTTASAVTDHIVSVTNGGRFWDSTNWQALCVPCHNTKTANEQAERRK